MTDTHSAAAAVTPATDTPVTPTTPDAIAAGLPIVRSAARWFWWIAGLSLVNIALFHSGSDTNFVVGLGLTTVIDVVFADMRALGFVIDALLLGFFFAMGLFAQRGRMWAFFVGVVVYALDALIYVRVGDWMPVGFHALAIFFIVKGALALREALRDAAI